MNLVELCVLWIHFFLLSKPFIDAHLNDSFDPALHINRKLLPLDICGQAVPSSHQNRIVGGVEMSMGAYPWMVRVGYETKDPKNLIRFFCGGSLISKYYVLTAAHCDTQQYMPARAFVRLGEYNIETDPDCELIEGVKLCADPVQDILLAKFIPHEEYSTSKWINDVALIRLEHPPVFGAYVQPVCLPVIYPKREDLDNKIAIAAGWGYMRTLYENGEEVDTPGTNPTIPREVALQVWNLELCQEWYAMPQYKTIITKGQMCAGGVVGQDACTGDSGGPLMWNDPSAADRFYLVGVTSFGLGCASTELPGIYTDVFSYLSWIMDHMVE